MALKFGSKAWRAKYLKKGRKNSPKKRKTTKRRTGANTYTKRGAAAKRKRLKEMIVHNPPRKWTSLRGVKKFRIINGRVEFRKS